MKNKLFLIRHGENPANITKEFSCRRIDYSLTSKGRLQAEQTASVFQALDIDEIYASPLKRAAETARIIGDYLGLKVIIEERFRELDVGDLEATGGSPAGWVIHNQVLIEWMDGNLDAAFPGGENYWHAQGRMREGINRVLAGKNGQKVVVVGHGGLFTSTIKDLCPEVDLALLWQQENHNCSISELDLKLSGDRWVGKLLRWADYGHLSGAAARLVSGMPK